MEIAINKLKIDRTKLYTVNNYCIKYNISKPTVYKRIKEGLIKTIRINGVLFVDIS